MQIQFKCVQYLPLFLRARLHSKWCRLLLVSACIKLLISYYVLRPWIMSFMYSQPMNCNLGPQVTHDVRSLTLRVEHVLSILQINYVVCYGTLWAIIRRQTFLFPWSKSVQFCLRNDELVNLDEDQLRRHMRSVHLQLVYDNLEGIYSVTEPQPSSDDPLQVQLILFELVPLEVGPRYQQSAPAEYRRIGLKNRLLPADLQHKYPASLTDAPLKWTTLDSDLKLPIPHEGIEMQKYLYKTDWWTERKIC